MGKNTMQRRLRGKIKNILAGRTERQMRFRVVTNKNILVLWKQNILEKKEIEYSSSGFVSAEFAIVYISC